MDLSHAGNNTAFTFTVEYTLPHAQATPIDGPCDRESTITIRAQGWGQRATDASQIVVLFRPDPSSSATVLAKSVKILESLSMSNYSSTSLEVVVPILERSGEMQGSAAFAGVTSRFDWECFQPVIQNFLSISPPRRPHSPHIFSSLFVFLLPSSLFCRLAHPGPSCSLSSLSSFSFFPKRRPDTLLLMTAELHGLCQ